MKVLNFGSCNIDYVYQLDHVVAPGETEASTGMQIFIGGKGLNQSIAIARAGTTVYHAGAVGEDGDDLIKLLKDNGANVTFLKKINGKTGQAIIQVAKSAENAIFIYSGANGSITKQYVDEVLEHFTAGDLILLQNEITNVDYIVEKAFERGMTIAFNPSPINEEIAKIDFNKITYLLVNQEEAKAISGEDDELKALDYFKVNYPDAKIILTLGKVGSVYQDKQQRYFQPSFKVVAVDTTGAGDTFTGYFISGLVKGFELKKTLRYATCASAIAVSINGAAPSIPAFAEVENKIDAFTVNEEKPF